MPREGAPTEYVKPVPSCSYQILSFSANIAITRVLYKKHSLNYLPLLCDLSDQIYLFEYENFQGSIMELSGECRNVCDKALNRVGSIRVECGP